MGKHDEYLWADGTRMTVADFEAMQQESVKTLDATGCTALTELHAPNARDIDAGGCTALTEIHADNAEYIFASGCTALTELHADKATHIFATGCTALTEIHADKAERIYATGCASLTELHAPNAVYIVATGCTSLASLVDGGEDSRRYYFFGLQQQGKYRIFAGCRNYTPEQALAHWGPGGRSDRPDCLALVQKIIAEIKIREAA